MSASRRRELRELHDLAQEARQILYAVRKMGDEGFKSREEMNRTRNRILVMQARTGEIIKNLHDMQGLKPREGQQARRELVVVRTSIREVIRHVAEHSDYGMGGSFLGAKDSGPAEDSEDVIEVTVPAGLRPRTAVTDRRRCPLCELPLSSHRVSCRECRRAHHTECWQMFGGCAVEPCYLDPVLKRIEDGELVPPAPGEEPNVDGPPEGVDGSC